MFSLGFTARRKICPTHLLGYKGIKSVLCWGCVQFISHWKQTWASSEKQISCSLFLLWIRPTSITRRNTSLHNTLAPSGQFPQCREQAPPHKSASNLGFSWYLAFSPFWSFPSLSSLLPFSLNSGPHFHLSLCSCLPTPLSFPESSLRLSPLISPFLSMLPALLPTPPSDLTERKVQMEQWALGGKALEVGIGSFSAVAVSCSTYLHRPICLLEGPGHRHGQ